MPVGQKSARPYKYRVSQDRIPNVTLKLESTEYAVCGVIGYCTYKSGTQGWKNKILYIMHWLEQAAVIKVDTNWRNDQLGRSPYTPFFTFLFFKKIEIEKGRRLQSPKRKTGADKGFFPGGGA